MQHDSGESMTTTANADYEAWKRHEDCLAREDWKGVPFTPEQAVEFNHNANVAASFEKLGHLLHAIERQLKEVSEGTWEEEALCFRRFEPETHELAISAAEAIGAFKRKVFVECEKYKEKCK